MKELFQLKPFDVFNRLVIGGFVDHPYGPDQQRCLECIYFLPHRSWCDLPEIDLPGHTGALIAAYPELGVPRREHNEVGGEWGIGHSLISPSPQAMGPRRAAPST